MNAALVGLVRDFMSSGDEKKKRDEAWKRQDALIADDRVYNATTTAATRAYNEEQAKLAREAHAADAALTRKTIADETFKKNLPIINNYAGKFGFYPAEQINTMIGAN